MEGGAGLDWPGCTLAPVTSQHQCHNGGSYQEEQQVTPAQYSLGLIRYPQQAGNGLDEATWERVQQQAEYLSQHTS
ncbi:hypothetical protein DUI87_10895 [Hirundo rustica rustica]|uniref:Uncharacterized protein n=1 Tax=Hirundo rustica rustica TaxID=333673 RepID=A0A3M0KRF6_HIRRU|nr:hypothetical protein DUI87_10895 [Hirundo rustica rustica]